MTKKQTLIIAEKIEKDLLPFVRQPSRYIGGEINQIKKDLSTCKLTIALCFPDIYEIAMSHTGLSIIYDALNKTDNIAAERVFAPWLDAEKMMREKQIPLFTLESKAAVKSLDVIAFSLTNELCYTNLLNMLDLAGLDIRTCNRKESDPLVIAGGGMANCCEPIADFVDAFVLGEGEEASLQLAQFLLEQKHKAVTKKDILTQAAKKFDWLYVPSLYEFKYENDSIKSFKPILPELPTQFKNAVVDDFENAPVPSAPIVPFTQAVHERVSIEIMRGCPGRCRFCQVSFCKRPLRFRSVEKIVELAKTAYHATGFDSIGLLSLSTAEYPKLEELISELHEYFADKYVGISVPSLRIDRQLKLLPKLANSVRKSGLTIAVEAASEKLRQIINKPIKNEHLFAAALAAYKAGWKKLKLYFMVGLPGETEDDIRQIVNLSYEIAQLKKQIDSQPAQLNIAISWFVPKAHTPFAFFGQKSPDYFENAKKIIIDEKKKLRTKTLQFKFHNIERSTIESAIGRADRRMANIIENAWRNGAKFDLWNECFDYQIWQRAFEKYNTDLQLAAQRQFKPDEILPWQHLGGLDKQYLLKHFNQANQLI